MFRHPRCGICEERMSNQENKQELMKVNSKDRWCNAIHHERDEKEEGWTERSGYSENKVFLISFASQMIPSRLTKQFMNASIQHCLVNQSGPLSNLIRLSYKEHRVDALALGAEEGRDKLRKAAGRSKYPMSRRYPNGGTHLSKPQVPLSQYIT